MTLCIRTTMLAMRVFRGARLCYCKIRLQPIIDSNTARKHKSRAPCLYYRKDMLAVYARIKPMSVKCIRHHSLDRPRITRGSRSKYSSCRIVKATHRSCIRSLVNVETSSRWRMNIKRSVGWRGKGVGLGRRHSHIYLFLFTSTRCPPQS